MSTFPNQGVLFWLLRSSVLFSERMSEVARTGPEWCLSQLGNDFNRNAYRFRLEEFDRLALMIRRYQLGKLPHKMASIPLCHGYKGIGWFELNF